MLKIRNRRGWALALLLAWLLPALACNFPTRGRQVRALAEEMLRATLTALAEGQPEIASTPVPGATGTPLAPPAGLETPGLPVPPTAAPGGLADPGAFFEYPAQPGDTLSAVAARFGVEAEWITSPEPIPPESLLPPGQLLIIPNALGAPPYPGVLLPDSEVVLSPAAVGFDTMGFVQEAGGFLSTYEEQIDDQILTGAEIVQRVAVETSTNPRLLLAFLEHRSGWVRGQPEDPNLNYPLGYVVPGETGLFKELYLAAKALNKGYYAWRAGELTDLYFKDGSMVRISPQLNAGTVAVQFLFSEFYRQNEWRELLYGQEGFFSLYWSMFGDPWARAASIEPLLPAGLAQPPLELPFRPGERWSFTGGPHYAWTTGTPLGALDFSPVTGGPPCSTSSAWVTASAPGLVVRSRDNTLVLDLDGDGFEGTGWALVYLHIAKINSVPEGTWVAIDDPLGHPSCERGRSTGTHVHLVRKYNGEWLAADGPLPFVLSGWVAQRGTRSYEGYLVNGDQVVSASPGGASTSVLTR